MISVDLESSYFGEGTPYSGVEAGAAAANAAFGAAKVWNVFGTTGFSIVNFSSGPLVDSTGAATSASFSIFGVTSAYGSNSFSSSALLRDYFYWGTLATSRVIGWQIAGLKAGTQYVFYTYGSNSNAGTPREYSMLIDTDGDGLLADETAALVSTTPAASGYMVVVTADAAGIIRGQNSALDREANWAGFQLAKYTPPQASLPEPGSAALVGLGIAAAGIARRKRR